MPRIRSVKPEFWSSERLATRLPGADGRQARLLFIALWNACEDHGVCRGSPVYLRSFAFAYDDDVSSADVERWLAMLAAGGFITRYEVGGSHYIHVKGFREHQVINKPSRPTLPVPPPEPGGQGGGLPEDSRSAPGGLPEDSGSAPGGLPEDSRQEGKGKEGRGEEGSPPPAPEGRTDGQDSTAISQRPALALEVQQPPAQKRAAKEKKTPDPRHAPLVRAMCEAAPGYTFLGAKDGEGVSRCLALADAKPHTAGAAAPAEVLRRWRRCRVPGVFPTCRHILDLAENWNAFESEAPARGATHNPRAPVTGGAWTEEDVYAG